MIRSAPVARRQRPRDSRLQRYQQTGDQDQHRHDALERAGRQHEQQECPGQAAEHRGNADGHRPSPLAGQLTPVADRTADRAGHQADRVGDVGHDRRITEGEKGREGDQRPRADDRVDRPRRQPGSEDRGAFEWGHTTEDDFPWLMLQGAAPVPRLQLQHAMTRRRILLGIGCPYLQLVTKPTPQLSPICPPSGTPSSLVAPPANRSRIRRRATSTPLLPSAS